MGQERILSYWSSLEAIGCIRLEYISLDEWIPLGSKVMKLVKICNPKSKIWVNSDIDQYIPPLYLKTAFEALYNSNLHVFRTPKWVLYNIADEGTMLYDVTNFSNRLDQPMFVFSKERPKTINIRRFPKTSNRTRRTKMQKNGSVLVGEFNDGGGPLPNIWEYAVGNRSTDDSTTHPAPFPEALARDHILSWSNPGDVVLDPMVGSGTTAKMAKELGRRWLGFDISPEYVAIAQKRVRQTKTPLFVL